LEASITAIEAQRAQLNFAGAQMGDVSVGDVAGRDVMGQQLNQSAEGEANVGVMAGNIHGDVQTGGVRNQGLIQIFLQAAGIPTPSDDQREIVADYLDGLARRCDQLRLRGVVDWERKRGKAPDFTLSQVYITLAADAWVAIRVSPDQESLNAELEAGKPDAVLPQDARRIVAEAVGDVRRGHSQRTHPDGEEQATYQLQRPLLLTEALSQRHRLVLLGGPGSGKSTFLRHLAVALARAGDAATDLPGWSAGPLLPVYASLGAFAAWLQRQPASACDAGALWRYLLAISEHETLAGLGEALRKAFRRGRLLLLLDGLDEVADPVLRAQVAAAVAALADRHEAFVVVTCRSRSFDGAVAAPLAGWDDPVTLAPFTLGQIRHFVRGWYAGSALRGAFTPQEATGRAEALIERITALPTLRDLGKTPLLLTIITILHYYEGKLPEDRADLYEDMVQLLLTRWTQQRREAGAPQSLLERLAIPGLKETQLRQTLAALAYRAHQGERSADGRGLLEQSAVRDTFTQLFREFGLAPGRAYEQALVVLDYLEDESGLLLHEGGERYAFPHLTYEEYLAGTHLVAQDSAVRPLVFQQLAYAHWRRDPTRWREVILLALGHAVRIPRLETVALWLQFLLLPNHGERQRDTAELHQAAAFAAEALADIGGKGQFAGVSTIDLPALWARLASLLAEVVEGQTLPAAERVRAGVSLGELGDPRPGVCDLPPPMVKIQGGSFVIGESNDAINTVVIESFELARYPVTNAQFKDFIDAGGYDPSAPWWAIGGDWLREEGVAAPRYWDDARFGIARPNHPVVGVSWYEATAFCGWLTDHHLNDGHIYRLPSEAEWEYAARGSERRMYAWGDAVPDDERANFNQQYNGTSAVGCFPAGATPGTGLLDMTGNVWEWTRSKFQPYPYDPNDGREDFGNLTRKSFTYRGGAWFNQPIHLRAANRDALTPDFHDHFVGFRLARHLKTVKPL
ncbi:SUMF1/EgtB/PvdO family nonheme iron enzyme, partial [Oscillochloris sp. ZM17-4]|uniref:SUMF1/EgtB/PvdO family nonheme iron enzyme n=1 Tax=Oscillochloris sp. ZM17-4 TaxID=2866714 RepID=UPI001C72F5C5